MLCEEIDLLENRRYDYSLSDRINIVDCWGCLLENSMYKNINYPVLEIFSLNYVGNTKNMVIASFMQ